jgi:hypothetical protein
MCREQMKMTNYAHRLFIPAALFNFIAGVSFLFNFPLTAHILRLNAAKTDMLFVEISSGAVLLFGWAYWQIARDPIRNRNLIALGILAKFMAVGVGYGNFLAGQIEWPFALVVTWDLIFSGLFWQFLRNFPEDDVDLPSASGIKR